MNKPASDGVACRFILLFCCYFGLFYGCSYLVIGLTSPGGFYSPLIDNRFDLIEAFRDVLLQGASSLLNAAGIAHHVIGNAINVPHKVNVRVHPPCMGLGILSFWAALVLAYPHRARLKAIFLPAGSVFLITLNILRIFLLGYIYGMGMNAKNSQIDHHFVFNLIAYAILAMMAFTWLNLPRFLSRSKMLSAVLLQAKE